MCLFAGMQIKEKKVSAEASARTAWKFAMSINQA